MKELKNSKYPLLKNTKIKWPKKGKLEEVDKVAQLQKNESTKKILKSFVGKQNYSRGSLVETKGMARIII